MSSKILILCTLFAFSLSLSFPIHHKPVNTIAHHVHHMVVGATSHLGFNLTHLWNKALQLGKKAALWIGKHITAGIKKLLAFFKPKPIIKPAVLPRAHGLIIHNMPTHPLLFTKKTHKKKSKTTKKFKKSKTLKPVKKLTKTKKIRKSKTLKAPKKAKKAKKPKNVWAHLHKHFMTKLKHLVEIGGTSEASSSSELAEQETVKSIAEANAKSMMKKYLLSQVEGTMQNVIFGQVMAQAGDKIKTAEIYKKSSELSQKNGPKLVQENFSKELDQIASTFANDFSQKVESSLSGISGINDVTALLKNALNSEQGKQIVEGLSKSQFAPALEYLQMYMMFN